MKIKFNYQNEDFGLELFQDAFHRYSAQIIRLKSNEDDSFSCESIIIDTCKGKIEVYDDVDIFGGRELVLSRDFEQDEMTEKDESEILHFMKDFLLEFYLNINK